MTPRTVTSLLEVSRRLTDRDLRLARLLVEHRTLTTAQIVAAEFTHPGTARNRLRQLRRMGFLDAFVHRPRAGRSPSPQVTCWVPGLLAARYVAVADDLPIPTPRAVRQTQDRILANPQLDHLLGVNQFFTGLIAHSRAHPGTQLVRWWSAERTANAHAGRIHPDGHGIWRAASRPGPASTAQTVGRQGTSAPSDPVEKVDPLDPLDDVGFWLEHDTGTEPLTRVLAKLEAYHRLQQSGGPTLWVLFRFPSTVREGNFQRLLRSHPTAEKVAVATAVHRHLWSHEPGEVGSWHPAGDGPLPWPMP